MTAQVPELHGSPKRAGVWSLTLAAFSLFLATCLAFMAWQAPLVLARYFFFATNYYVGASAVVSVITGGFTYLGPLVIAFYTRRLYRALKSRSQRGVRQPKP